MTGSEDYKAWLAGLKVGDKVAVMHKNLGTPTYYIDKIKKITPTRQIDTENCPPRFKNGEVPNHDVWPTYCVKLVPLTQEVLDYIEKENLLNWITKVDKRKLPLEQLRQIKAIIEWNKEEK